MYIIVAYDIVDNRKRTRVAKMLTSYGNRVQKSVFECRIDDKQYLKLRGNIKKIIDHEEDSVRYYTLCSRCMGNIEISGWGTVNEDEDVIIV